MGLIQDLQGRKLTGCRGCDAIRMGLYKGLDLWKPTIQAASTHDSFDASSLGAYIESPAKARGSAVASGLCSATVTDVVESASSSTTISEWGGGSITLNAGYDSVTFRMDAFALDTDLWDRSYGLLATGGSSGATHDFYGTSIDALSGGARSYFRHDTTNDIWDRIFHDNNVSETEFTRIHWEVRYQNGASNVPSPFWSNGETVSIPCPLSTQMVFTNTDFIEFIASGTSMTVCGEGSVNINDFVLRSTVRSATAKAPLISGGIISAQSYFTNDSYPIIDDWMQLDNVVIEDTSADFSGRNTTCWRRQAQTQSGQGENEFIRLKRTDAPDANNRVTYEGGFLSTTITPAANSQQTLQLVPA